jgi:hypothetical protein
VRRGDGEDVMAWLLVVPFVVQAIAMAVDEFYFHRKRGLGLWERIGHPVDTLTTLACIAWVLAVPPTTRTVTVYLALAFVSCLCITKDEFVHARRCSPGEHWLHALLFVLHPMCLAVLGLLWPAQHGSPSALPAWLASTSVVGRLLLGQFLLTGAFGLYQTFYWNLPWTKRPVESP